MRKLFFAALMMCLCVNVFADPFTPYYKYRVYLKDKKHSEYSVRHPEAFLSDKAIERRKRQGLKIDKTDLPVCAAYLQEIRGTGVNIVHTSKWNNTVVVSCTDTLLMEKVAGLPFVSSVLKVAYYNKDAINIPFEERTKNLEKVVPFVNYDSYGPAGGQIEQINGRVLHNLGYKGRNMTIAVIDGGFYNADVIEGLKNTNIIGIKDFSTPVNDFYATESHGTMVLSCIGANEPYYQIGTAPEASFWLIRSEDGGSEQPVEEDNWAAAIEFADSVGADVVNTSLGYNDFDSCFADVTYSELDGKTHLISRSASMVASKGMILCCSAGNSGDEAWKKITPPGDAKDVLTAGAIDPQGILASFSSIGNTADNRVKPDVVTRGKFAICFNETGGLSGLNGTSFSSPILTGMVACLWQALPDLTTYEIMDIVRKSGDRADEPDNIYGYGIPDFYKAYTIGIVRSKKYK